MIKMYIPDLDKIAEEHVNSLYSFCINRINFLLVVLDFFENKIQTNFDSLNITLGEPNKKRELINSLLERKLDFKPNIKKLTFTDLSNIYLEYSISQNIPNLKNLLENLKNEKVLKYFLTAKEKTITLNIIQEKFLRKYNFNIHKKKKGLKDPKIKGILEVIFDYEHFSDKDNNTYGAYELAKKLNIKTCPYCNRCYTSTVITEKIDKGKVNRNKILRPTFDHFYSKSNYPLFGISFYNLVPSCYFCNSSLKLDKDFSTKTHINPYYLGFDNDAKFKVIFDFPEIPKNIELEILIPLTDKKYSKINSNKIDFCLEEIYQEGHFDIVEGIHQKIKKFNFLDSINNVLSDIKGIDTKKEFYEFIFSNKYDIENFQNRPLSKFTKDIFDDFKDGYSEFKIVFESLS